MNFIQKVSKSYNIKEALIINRINMKNSEKKSIRVWSNISPEVDKQIKEESKRRGLSKSSLIRECIMLNK